MQDGSTHRADIDIDLPDRNKILALIKHTPARKLHLGKPERHNSGVYVQPIPFDPHCGCATLHFKEADTRGYFKLDFLNVSVYQHIKDQAHYDELLAIEPPWHRLKDATFVEQIIHISNYPRQVAACMPDSIPRMAMFISALRPGKKHLLGKPWADVAKEIWVREGSDGYAFRQSHAISYAVLVGLHMNIVNRMS